MAALFAVPTAFVLWRTVRLGEGIGDVLSELNGPAWRTLQLAVLVSLSAAVVGSALAWLTVRTDLPFCRMWRIVLLLPLVLPSFVGATALLAGLAPGGLIRSAIEALGLEAPRRMRGLFPSWLVLTALSYPYVMLPVSASLRALRPELDESARLLAHGTVSRLMRVTLPQISAAVIAGSLLVFLYSLSEFGAVQMLGYDTLTRVIYATRQVDRSTSFVSATAVLMMAYVVVVLSRAASRRVSFAAVPGRRSPTPERLGKARLPALLVCTMVALVAVVAPVLVLAQWAWRGARDDRVDFADLVSPSWNSASVAVIAAVVTIAVVLPVALTAVRHHGPVSAVASSAVIGGFALPGVVIALALAVFVLNTPLLDQLYQTMPLLIAAYLIHFGSQALAGAEQAVAAVPGQVRSAARLLEPSPWRRALVVDAPLMRPGLVAGGGLVMLSTLKELPSTLLLAPLGFRTLSTEVWGSFEEGFYADAAAAALVLLALSAMLSWFVVIRRGVGAQP